MGDHECSDADGTGAVAARTERRVVEVPAEVSHLRTIRRTVAAFVAENGGDDDLADDLVLSASELSTNVIQHSDAATVTVALSADGSTWQLDVSDAEAVPRLDSIVAPAAGSMSGRGLVIVKQLMDDVRTVEVDGRTVIRCTRHMA